MKLTAIFPIFLFTCSLLTVPACDSSFSDRIAMIEKTIEKQKTQIEDLQVKCSEIRDEQLLQNFKKDIFKSASFDPANTKEFQRLDTSFGTFFISIQEVMSQANGVNVRLNVGNVTTATFSGGTFKLKWGPRRPKEGQTSAASVAEWGKALHEIEQKFTEELYPGTWNTITLWLTDTSSDKFGYLELQLETNQIKLKIPRK